MGRHDEAVREARLAVAIDPVSNLARGQLALVLYLAGRLDEAIEEARSAPIECPVGMTRLLPIADSWRWPIA